MRAWLGLAWLGLAWLGLAWLRFASFRLWVIRAEAVRVLQQRMSVTSRKRQLGTKGRHVVKGQQRKLLVNVLLMLLMAAAIRGT
jgi:hypothetical protein